MYHVFALLKQVSTVPTQARRSHTSDQIVAPGSLDPVDEHVRESRLREVPIPSKLVVLAVAELLLPASGLLLGLLLWRDWLWLLLGAGIFLSVLVGYAFRSDTQLYPLDLLHR
jgi:hypothetical protein